MALLVRTHTAHTSNSWHDELVPAHRLPACIAACAICIDTLLTASVTRLTFCQLSRAYAGLPTMISFVAIIFKVSAQHVHAVSVTVRTKCLHSRMLIKIV